MEKIFIFITVHSETVEQRSGTENLEEAVFSAPVNKRIKIKNNVFESSDRALEIRDVQNGEISGNQYRNIREAIFVEKETVENVLIAESERKGLL